VPPSEFFPGFFFKANYFYSWTGTAPHRDEVGGKRAVDGGHFFFFFNLTDSLHLCVGKRRFLSPSSDIEIAILQSQLSKPFPLLARSS